MTFCPDLSACTFFVGETRLLAVGWLDDSHSFPTGPVPREVFDALAKLLMNPWQPFVSAGGHECELCRSIRVGTQKVPVGSANLFVPTEDVVYAAPSLILHYIDTHRYQPPGVFQDAVLRCPPMGSPTYLQLVHAHRLERLKPNLRVAS